MRRVALLVLILTGCFRTVAPRVEVTTLPAPGAFPHELLDQVLAAHVDAQGRIDYASIRDDRATLDRYVGTLALLSPASHPDHFPTRDHALAYWINAYNALAITGVIDRPGLDSVGNHKFDFFYATRYRLGGARVHLYKLENGIIRAEFDEPRIHWALNCQSAGCPRMLAEVFRPETLDEQLAEVATEFVTTPSKVRLADDGFAELSEIFKWYDDDFEAMGGPVAAANAWGASLPDQADVRWIPYDWTLIAQPGRGP